MFSGTLAEAHRDHDVMRVIAGQIEATSWIIGLRRHETMWRPTIDGVKVTVDGVPPIGTGREFTKNGFEEL